MITLLLIFAVFFLIGFAFGIMKILVGLAFRLTIAIIQYTIKFATYLIEQIFKGLGWIITCSYYTIRDYWQSRHNYRTTI